MGVKATNSSVKVYRSRGGTIFIIIILAILAAFMALPLLYTATLAFKPIDELFKFPPSFFVKRPTLLNFKTLFSVMNDSLVPFSRYIFNSVYISVIGTFGEVIIASMAAYAFSKHKFPGSKLFFNMIVFSLMFSAYVTGIPRFIIMSKLHWLDTYASLILPMMSGSLGLYLMKQFIDQMPDAMIEAARIDGASEFKIWWSIIMPNVKSAWLTLVLFTFKDFWTDMNSPTLYLHTEAKKTLPLAFSYIQNGGIARMGATAAAGLLMMLPPIIIFICTQSNVIETMKSSGMKD